MKNKQVKNNLFIHIPKTAGTSIKDQFQILQPLYNKHATLQEVYNDLGIDYIKSNSPFTIVRNPYDRLVSWFYFHIDLVDPLYRKKLYPYASFKDWIKNGAPIHWTSMFAQDSSPKIFSDKFNNTSELHKPKWISTANFFSQLSWITIDNSANAFLDDSRIFKFEDIQKRLKYHINKTNRELDYRKYYDSESIEIVTKLCKTDLEYFNYTYEKT
tara:strand:+ start:351 stop:992 length:642 start_codon:yes stop_codon:yes gene_type:complete